jgi:hypothetical protein
MHGHIGASLGAIGVVIAIIAAAMAGLGAPWWAWTGFAIWGLLWVTAASGLSDEASRKFLSGTLRKSTFTQIYTTLARRNVMGIWNRVCDPAPDTASLPTFFHAALTWRLYDRALLIAVAYPILLLVGQWVIKGDEGRVGSFVVLAAADFWPQRAKVVLLLLFFVIATLHVLRTPKTQRIRRLKTLGLLAGALLFFQIVAISRAEVGELTRLLAVALLLILAAGATVIARAVTESTRPETIAAGYALAAAPSATGIAALAVVMALALPVTILLFIALGAIVLIYFCTGMLVAYFDTRKKQRLIRFGIGALVACQLPIIAIVLDWSAVSTDRRSLFLFLAMLPLFNALFDVVSYAVTLSLIRRGLRSRLPFLWGLADLGLACVLLLGLGATLVAVIHGLNLAAGVPFLDLPALFEGVQDDPWAYVWLYLMLFSTLLPTLLHGLLSLLGLQGIWPLGLRRPVAGWVAAAPASPLHAIRASLGLSLIWALPLLGLAGVLWGIWHYAQPLLMDGLQLYLDGLLWIATHPVGAI